MPSWNEKWNEAFEKSDPALAARALQEVLVVIQAASGGEKAYALLAAASCYAVLGNEIEARRSLGEARKIATNDDRVFQMNADFLVASWDIRQGNFEQALQALNELCKDYAKEIREPQLRYLYEQVHFSRGLALAELQRFEEAQPLLEEARSFDLVAGDKALLHFHLGTSYMFVKEDYRSALRSFEDAQRAGLGPNWQAAWHYYVGRAYYRLKDYANAKQEFLKAEQYIKSGLPGPESSDLYKLLAYSCKGLRQTAEAEMYSRLSTPA